MPDTTTQDVRIQDPLAREGRPLMMQRGFPDRLETWNTFVDGETLPHKARLRRGGARGHGHRDQSHYPEASGRELLAGDGVANSDAVHRLPLNLPDGQWREIAPAETARAVPQNPRRRGWRLVATAAVAIAGLVAALVPATAAVAAVPALVWQPCSNPAPSGMALPGV